MRVLCVMVLPQHFFVLGMVVVSSNKHCGTGEFVSWASKLEVGRAEERVKLLFFSICNKI